MNEAYMEVGGQCGKYFRRNMIFLWSQSKDALLHILMKTDGKDTYYCTYLFDKQDRSEGTKFFSPLYFDIDGDITTDEGFENLRMAVLSLVTNLSMDLHLKTNEMKFYFSGSKGFHVFVGARVLAIPACENLNQIYKAFVQHIKQKVEHGELIDTKIYDNKRLIRIPNTINGKTGLYKIPIQYSELRTIKREELLKKASEPQPEYQPSSEQNPEAAARFRECIQKLAESIPKRSHERSKIPETKQALPICMKHLLEADVSKGGRNNYLAMLSSILIQNGYSEEEAMDIIEVWNANLSVPLEDRELFVTLRSAAKLAREGHGYGCTSIREKDVFPPREVCPHCRIYQKMRRN